jgi:hypothetical protein
MRCEPRILGPSLGSNEALNVPAGRGVTLFTCNANAQTLHRGQPDHMNRYARAI